MLAALSNSHGATSSFQSCWKVPAISIVAFAVAALLGCGNGSGSSEDGRVASVASLSSPPFARLSADPNGMLLPGAPQDSALLSTGWMAPTRSTPGETSSEGVLLDRIAAVIAPNATVEEVNTALMNAQSTILSMSGGNPIVVLRIPSAVDEAEAQLVADAIAMDDAFLSARTLRSNQATNASSALVPFSADSVWHWDAMNLWSAWNLGEGLSSTDSITVFNADYFDSELLPAGLSDSIEFLIGSGGTTEDDPAGLHSLGLISGALDSATPGVAPDRGVQLKAFLAGDFNAIELMHEIAWLVGDTNLDHYILRTTYLYPSFDVEEFGTYSRGERAFDALAWRLLVETTPGLRDPEILHFVPAGANDYDNPEAERYQSPWAVSASYADLLAFAEEGGDADAMMVRPVWDAYASANPAIAQASADVYAIAAMDPAGQIVPGTAGSPSTMLKAPGELIPGACLVGCTSPGLISLTGSEVASSIVTGAAAFMWLMDPEQTAEQIAVRLALSPSLDGNFINLYEAMLTVDSEVGLLNAPVRRKLLDVAGPTFGNIAPNGLFDEIDVETFLEFFEQFETQRASNGVNVDHSRFDLNGNGYTGEGESEVLSLPVARFDLDASSDSTFGSVFQEIDGTEVEFLESDVTDLETLCYYAYSGLYVGDLDARDDLLLALCAGLEIDSTFPEDVDLGVPETLDVLVGSSDGNLLVGEPGIEIEISVVGGAAVPSSGVSDAQGLFSTEITATLDGPLEIEIRATAADGRSAVRTLTANAGFMLFTIDAPDEVPFDSTFEAIVTLRDETGLPVEGEGIRVRSNLIASISATSNLNTSPDLGITDENGQIVFTLRAIRVGASDLSFSLSTSTAAYPIRVLVPPPTIRGERAGFIDSVGCFERLTFTAEDVFEESISCDDGNRSVSANLSVSISSVVLDEGEVRFASTVGSFSADWSNASSARLALTTELGDRIYIVEPATVTVEIDFSNPPSNDHRTDWRIGGLGITQMQGTDDDPETITFSHPGQGFVVFSAGIYRRTNFRVNGDGQLNETVDMRVTIEPIE